MLDPLFTGEQVRRACPRSARELRESVLLTAWTPRRRERTAWLEWRGKRRAKGTKREFFLCVIELREREREREREEASSLSPEFLFFSLCLPLFFWTLQSRDGTKNKVKRLALCFFFFSRASLFLSLLFRQGRCCCGRSLAAAPPRAQAAKKQRAKTKKQTLSFSIETTTTAAAALAQFLPCFFRRALLPIVASIRALSLLPTRQREHLPL